jgi:hypothetical protein
MKPQHNDPAFDALLRSRQQPLPPEGLEERIILAATRLPQQPRTSIRFSLGQLLAEAFALTPKPAYAMASAMMLGILVGFGSSPLDTTPGNNAATPKQTALYDTLYDDGEIL